MSSFTTLGRTPFASHVFRLIGEVPAWPVERDVLIALDPRQPETARLDALLRLSALPSMPRQPGPTTEDHAAAMYVALVRATDAVDEIPRVRDDAEPVELGGGSLLVPVAIRGVPGHVARKHKVRLPVSMGERARIPWHWDWGVFVEAYLPSAYLAALREMVGKPRNFLPVGPLQQGADGELPTDPSANVVREVFEHYERGSSLNPLDRKWLLLLDAGFVPADFRPEKQRGARKAFRRVSERLEQSPLADVFAWFESAQGWAPDSPPIYRKPQDVWNYTGEGCYWKRRKTEPGAGTPYYWTRDRAIHVLRGVSDAYREAIQGQEHLSLDDVIAIRRAIHGMTVPERSPEHYELERRTVDALQRISSFQFRKSSEPWGGPKRSLVIGAASRWDDAVSAPEKDVQFRAPRRKCPTCSSALPRVTGWVWLPFSGRTPLTWSMTRLTPDGREDLYPCCGKVVTVIQRYSTEAKRPKRKCRHCQAVTPFPDGVCAEHRPVRSPRVVGSSQARWADTPHRATRAAVYGCTTLHPEHRFLGWYDDKSDDEWFKDGAWGIVVRRIEEIPMSVQELTPVRVPDIQSATKRDIARLESKLDELLRLAGLFPNDQEFEDYINGILVDTGF